MRSIFQFFLIIFFVAVYLIGLVSGTLKFRLFNYNFWTSSFQKYDIYEKVVDVGKKAFEYQIVKEGGSKNEAKVLTDLITKESVKEIIERNLASLLEFVNGKSSRMTIYLPTNNISDNFLSYESNPNIYKLSLLGLITHYVFIVSSALAIVLLLSLFLLTEKGKRFIGIGVALLLSGGIALLIVNLTTNLSRVFISNIGNSYSVVSVAFETVVIPLMPEIFSWWQLTGIISLTLGIIVLVFKKR